MHGAYQTETGSNESMVKGVDKNRQTLPKKASNNNRKFRTPRIQ